MMFLIICFVILLAIGVPIAFALGAGSFFTLLAQGTPLVILPQKVFSALNSFSLIAVPLFLFAGEMMNASGITNRIIRFASSLVGHIRGGLCHASVVAGMVFAGVSGSANADTAALASVIVPAMKEEGYDEDVSVSVVAAAGTMGPIIPPSIPMVIYSSITGLSIGKLFAAGVIPGILFGLSMMFVSYIYAVKRRYVKRTRASIKEIWHAFKKAFLSLLAPLIILGGIIGGVGFRQQRQALLRRYML